jgi:RND family efflux transporter MFP subunit
MTRALMIDRGRSMLYRILGVLLVAAGMATLAACGRGGDATGKAIEVEVPAGKSATANHPTQLSLLISPEDVVTIASTSLASGPSITGSVQPERRADLRAEIAAVVLQVLKENGDVVKQGDLLVRLDDTAIRDGLNSAEASERAVTQAYEQAQRQYQRLSKLRDSGMVSTQAVEDAEVLRNNSQSELQAAKSRAAQARQQLQRTEARAPFDGIVSDRKVSAGDTAQVGKELVKVIDPRSMRFEGLVSADSIGQVKVGQTVSFRVHGYAEQEFIGKVTRVNPAANVTTRQVEVLVNFVNAGQQPKLAGLYAEGRIATSANQSLTIPASALVKEGEQAFAWRVDNNAVRKVSLVLGDRDARSGEYSLKSGLTAGDRLLRYPSATLTDGQKVELAGVSKLTPSTP